MSKGSEELLKGRTDQIDYDEVLKKYPWIIEEGHCCILSPDSDGLLCGLLMAKYKKWKICGFYDDKVAVVNKTYLTENPIFLDGEVFRRGIRSMGHHMLTVNHKRRPEGYDEGFENCIQPNLMRGYDKKLFQLKYPLATVHMLVGILAYSLKDSKPISISEKAIPPLFFTDGVYSTMFNYTENVLNWLHYLRIDEDWNPLKAIFENDKYSVFTLMKEMNEFFRKRDKCNATNQRGDRLRISEKSGEPFNLEGLQTGTCHIATEAVDRICRFMTFIGEMTGWLFRPEDWNCWEGLEFFKFSKGSFGKNGDNKTLTIEHFNAFIKRKPLSWAMTSGSDIEYTIETPSVLPFDLYRTK